MWILKNDVSICYETFGNPENPCVIMVTGIASQLVHWSNELTQGLAEKGFYVVTFDNRDVGLSSYYDHLETPDLGEAIASQQFGGAIQLPYTLADMSDDILALMDGLHIDKAHIVGVSMGGEIAQIFAINHGERLLSLSLISTSSRDAGLPPPSAEVMDFFFRPAPAKDDLEAAINQHVAQYKIYYHPDDVDEQEIRNLHEKAYQRAYHPEGNQRQLLAMIFVEPRGEELKQVQIPALIIHGDIDPVVSIEHGERLAACIPNSRLEIMEKMGHGIPARLNDKFIDLLHEHFS